MSRDWAYGFATGAITGVIIGLVLSRHKTETIVVSEDIQKTQPAADNYSFDNNYSYNLQYEPESVIQNYTVIDQERKEGKKDILTEPLDYPENAETLLLYSDNILAFESDDEIVYDIGEIIDLDEFEKFVNSPLDTIYITDVFGNYYAIYKVNKTYSEMTGRDVQYIS